MKLSFFKIYNKYIIIIINYRPYLIKINNIIKNIINIIYNNKYIVYNQILLIPYKIYIPHFIEKKYLKSLYFKLKTTNIKMYINNRCIYLYSIPIFLKLRGVNELFNNIFINFQKTKKINIYNNILLYLKKYIYNKYKIININLLKNLLFFILKYKNKIKLYNIKNKNLFFK
ncbi:MAG: hypothetical protein NHG06_00525 [Candidatus Shikimatogenerans sp. JK-2022]|nr:hypothetical protein [Candidatus Shikimatogenerans bostrichidophilus]MDH3005068.1 hypothetical protein [Candidatus Shikimatogenerans bostrichidophilus]